MRIVKNDQVFYFRWRYEHPRIEARLQKKNVTMKDARKMSKWDLDKLLGIKQLPPPVITHCIVETADKKIQYCGTIKLHREDVYDVEKARKTSLRKALKLAFPGEGPGDDRELRKEFWNAYFTRAEKKSMRHLEFTEALPLGGNGVATPAKELEMERL